MSNGHFMSKYATDEGKKTRQKSKGDALGAASPVSCIPRAWVRRKGNKTPVEFPMREKTAAQATR